MRIGTMKAKTSIGRKIACIFMCFVMVVTFTPFSMQAVFADTNEKVQESENADPVYGTEEYWKQELGLSSITYHTFSAGQTLTNSGGENSSCNNYYFIKTGTTLTAAAGKNGLTIGTSTSATPVVIVFVGTSRTSGPTLTATGAAGSGTTGGGAGINLPSGKYLTVKGVGTLKATGGKAPAPAVGGTGGDGRCAGAAAQ